MTQGWTPREEPVQRPCTGKQPVDGGSRKGTENGIMKSCGALQNEASVERL